jgi:hypothetical protein
VSIRLEILNPRSYKIKLEVYGVKEKLQQGNLQQKVEDYKLESDEFLRYRGRIFVPNSRELKNLILGEMHNVPYVGHPGYQKTIAIVKSQYYWSV